MTAIPLSARRIAATPAILVFEVAVVVLSPLLCLIAAVISPLAGGSRPLRVLAMAVDYAIRHLACTAACAGLWVASGFGRHERSAGMQHAHYAVLRWFVAGIHGSVTRRARVNVQIAHSQAAEKVLAEGGPVIVLSRHAGEGDSLLVLYELLCRHRRRARIVLHEALRVDPLIDVLGHRLPNRFVDPRGGDTEAEIAALAMSLGDCDAVLIFPEGGNFSIARRQRGIERLQAEGHDEQAAAARQMRHVCAPRPGGTLAALHAAPTADVIFIGHSGVPTGLRDLWRALAEGQTVEMRLWTVPATDIPSEHDEQIDWLFRWWRTLDAWVGEHHDPPPATRHV